MFSSLRIAAVLSVAGALVVAGTALAGSGTIKVQKNGDGNWAFNPDAANATPYEFSLAQRSIGGGSLYVEPIGPPNAHKFIANQPMGTLVSDLQSISYDFLIAGNGDSGDAEQFYLNVYTFMPTPNGTFYDCRFDYVPATGSTAGFTTASFAPGDPPVHVQPQNGTICPGTLADMPAGSTISFFALNVGDTSGSDNGLAGYLDNVVVAQSTGSTTFDFDPTSDACKKGGYVAGGYEKQGQCVSAIQSS
jgi:hypothetical protein